MERNTVKFKLGGREFTTRVEISLAPIIEDATDMGLLALARLVVSKEARTSQVITVIRETLKANDLEYTSRELLDMLAKEGVFEAYSIAGRILNVFFAVPKDDGKPTKGKQKAEVAA